MAIKRAQLVNDSFRCEERFQFFVDVLAAVAGPKAEDWRGGVLGLSSLYKVLDAFYCTRLFAEESYPGVP